MSEPVWIERDALAIAHEAALADHGGPAGVRDAGLLDSALARARNALVYGETDVCALAAFYAHGVIKNHPFVDGNKRTAFLAAAAFLELNGLRFTAAEAEAAAMTIALAAGEVDAEAYAAWLRANAHPAS